MKDFGLLVRQRLLVIAAQKLPAIGIVPVTVAPDGYRFCLAKIRSFKKKANEADRLDSIGEKPRCNLPRSKVAIAYQCCPLSISRTRHRGEAFTNLLNSSGSGLKL